MNLLIRWMLRDNAPLLGDLLEERATGRSRAWFYRQVTVAVARSMVASARRHPVLLARAALAAMFCYLITVILTAVGEGYFYGYYFSPAEVSKINPTSIWIAGPIALIPSVFTGWFVVRTHRSCAPAAIVASILLWTPLAAPWDWIAGVSIAGFLAGALLDVTRNDVRRDARWT